MSKNFSAKKAILFGACAGAAYKFIKGEGVFNKPRFYSQHKAIENYLNTYYTDAKPGKVVKNDSGWHCIVTTSEKSFVLNLHRTEEGMYLFSETDL